MLKFGTETLFSASDLIGYLECTHSTTLDLINLGAPLKKAVDDDHAQLIQEKGFAHEAAYLASLRRTGCSVVDLSGDLGLDEAVAATRQAMAMGVPVIFQATLQSGRFFGHADFLRKVPFPSHFGNYSYEVVDTKLARSTKSKFLVQLAFYSDLLGAMQGSIPQRMHVVLGDAEEKSFRVADYGKYTALLRERFLLRVTEGGDTTYPEPCGHCQVCRWRDLCGERWLADDHLSQVAGISRMQIRKLENSGVRTMADLGKLSANSAVAKMSSTTLARLRHQAALQVAYRETGQRCYALLSSDAEPSRGFARLPQPDPHDLYFDIEGDPLEEGGLEYLLGLFYREDGENCFRSFWAHNRTEERASFEAFMDFISPWLARYPGAHVYHYASYEETALKQLMTNHGTREAEVDRILRQGRLVDLYKVIKEAIRTSEPGYSIKNIERFYMPARDGAVQSAGASIVFYERWKESQDMALLAQIESYNRDDLVSTRLLREWLVSLKPANSLWKGEAEQVACEEPEEAPTEGPNEIEIRLDKYRRLLVADLSPDRGAWTEHEQLRELVYQLLDFHRREAKPAWWAVFSRMDMEVDELIEDAECIGGMTLDPDAPPRNDKRSRIYNYRFPPQDFKIKLGASVRRCYNAAPAGAVVALSEDAGTLALRIGERAEPLPDSLSIGPGGPIKTDSLRDAIFRVADAVVETNDKYRAVLGLLQKHEPRLIGRPPGRPVIAGRAEFLDEAAEAACLLDRSYLVVQGPPGAGKTYTGARIIVELLRRGKSVGITSNSHKVINHLLSAVEERADAEHVHFVGMKKATSRNDDSIYEGKFISSAMTNKDLLGAGAQLFAGTAWLFADPALDQKLDYLFIDEAGQVSLANVVATGASAHNIVLLGDQMQLGQPSQACHPGRSGNSALEYLLDGLATIPDERGIFLPDTWRMQKDVCTFISNAVYDGRLIPAPGTENQQLVLTESAHHALRPTGLRFVEVEHDGCTQSSEEEAVVVTALYESLLHQHWTNTKGTLLRIAADDILVVAPYNIQVNLLKRKLPGTARVGTVDKFQGQEAAVVIVSMATSNGDCLPRNIEFLYSKNRLNVAISRARCLALIVASPDLLAIRCNTPEQMALVNTLCWAYEYSRTQK